MASKIDIPDTKDIVSGLITWALVLGGAALIAKMTGIEYDLWLIDDFAHLIILAGAGAFAHRLQRKYL
ncbi:MAG: hypothetical protein AAFQ67_00705 [Pseudomonadota bacterium]